jgi:phosphate butyryltransferase
MPVTIHPREVISQMEQIRTLGALLEYAKEVGPKKISVACAEDAEVMEAVENARKAGVAEAFLVGNADKIKEVADKLGIDLANYEVVDEKGGEAAAALKAVELVSSGQAQIVKKGFVQARPFPTYTSMRSKDSTGSSSYPTRHSTCIRTSK